MNVPSIFSTSNANMNAMQHAAHDTELANFQRIFESAVDARNNPDGVDRGQIRRAAEMFESYFIQMMFREMRRTNFNENGIIPRSNAETIFTEMLDETMADVAAERGGFGLADMLYRQMTRDL